MTLFRLALRNIAGDAFRSWVIFLCALILAGFSVSATLIIRGAEESLRLIRERLGADILVVPRGSEAKVETALLMGKPTTAWMPEGVAKQIAALPGVAAASPQLYLASLANASCCDASEMFVVAFDPQTDFTITPWLTRRMGGGLGLGEVVGGRFVHTPSGERYIKLYGYHLRLKTNLEPTGTGLDQTMFLTFETARAVANGSRTLAEKPLDIPPGSISAVLVNIQPGSDPQRVALRIRREIEHVTAISSLDLFQGFRREMSALLRSVLVILGLAWALAILLIGLVFSMAIHERRRVIGVLRALGASRRFVFHSILAEAGILALGGGSTGIALAVLATYLFRNLLVLSLDTPFLLPTVPSLLGVAGGGLIVALLSVALAAVVPTYRISRQDPAVAMRE